MKLYTTSATFVCASLLTLSAAITYAQPVITADQYMAQQLSMDTFNVMNAPQGFTPGAAGANTTWNFSDLSTSVNAAIIETGPCPGRDVCSTFPDITHYARTTNTANPAIFSETAYKKSAAQLEVVGREEFAGGGGTAVVTYSDTKIAMKFPVTYGLTFSDGYSTTNVPNPISARDTTVIDGYGTLITPVGTYNNVLRIKSTGMDTSGTAGAMFVSSKQVYTWQSAADGVIMSAVFSSILLPEPQDLPAEVSYSTIAPQSTTSIDDVDNSKHVSIYPNPVTGDVINVTVKDDQIKTIVISDITGKIVLKEAINNSMINGVVHFPVKSLDAGMYLVHIFTGKATIIRKMNRL